MNKGLLALAIGTFALGIAEFSMMGVLGDVSRSLGISISDTGHAITAYALGVSVGAPGLILFRRMPLRRLLVALAIVMTVGNLFASLAGGYWTLLVARFISGLPHGAYFGVSAIVAQKLVQPGKGAEAVAAMVAGMTVANVIGVPGVTFLSNAFTWRLTFATVALFGLVAVITLSRWVPSLEPLPDTGIRGQFKFLRQAAPWLIFATTFFGQGSVYCWFSYIEPAMTRVTGFSLDSMTWIMIVAGLGMVAGNVFSGKLADKFGAPRVVKYIVVLILLILPSIYFCSQIKWLSIILMFFATATLFGVGGPLQFLIVKYSKGGEMLGAAGIQIAFNVSNAIASLIGGMAISQGLGYESPALVGIPFAIVALVTISLLSHRTSSKVAA